MIHIQNLSFSYPGAAAPALQGLSLDVPQGSLFGLLGPNGSGKTTLISILSGLLPAGPASVKIGGLALESALPQIQAFSALVPQEYAFYPRLSVAENLEFFAGVQAIPKPQRAKRMAEVLEITGLEGTGSKRSERFSGGMKRRLNIAIGLLNRPRLLFLDEPTVGIDPQSRSFILQAVKRIQRQGCTVIYTSHYMEEIEAICDEVAVLDNGRLLLQGSMQGLLSNAQSSRLEIGLGAELSGPQKKSLARIKGLKISGRNLKLAACRPADFQALLRRLQGLKLPLARVQYGHSSLEELFLQLTKRKLRD